MSNSQNNRARFGYLTYDSMLKFIQNGKLNAYDINFSSDTKECYVIAPDLTPWSIKSKVYTFDDIESANEVLNQNSDTYAGQIVSILCDDKYIAYIVNKKDNMFYVTPLSAEKEVDYNTLGHKPIINLIGTLDEPVLIDSLDSGTYMIKGQYTISGIETIFLSASNVIFIVEHLDSTIYLKRITSSEITDFVISEDEVIQNSYITSTYLEQHGYITQEYVDTKITTLDFVTKDEISSYVESLIDSQLTETIEVKIDEKLSEKEVSTESIDALFEN